MTEHESHEELLKPRLTAEFLSTLIEAAKVVGWSVDLIEVKAFVHEVHDLAGLERPKLDLEPYEG